MTVGGLMPASRARGEARGKSSKEMTSESVLTEQREKLTRWRGNSFCQSMVV